MKIEFEIPEAEIEISAKDAAKKAVIARVNHWMSNDDITDKVRALWRAELDKQIAEALANSEALKLKIDTAIERKLRTKLEALMRRGEK
jgi:hypothetical protein